MTILKGYDIMYIKINWKMRRWSIVEKTKKKNWIIAIIVAIFYLAVSISLIYGLILGLYGLPMHFIDLSSNRQFQFI